MHDVDEMVRFFKEGIERGKKDKEVLEASKKYIPQKYAKPIRNPNVCITYEEMLKCCQECCSERVGMSDFQKKHFVKGFESVFPNVDKTEFKAKQLQEKKDEIASLKKRELELRRGLGK